MARSLRTQPRLNRTILSLTKEATGFVDAAPCDGVTATLADLYYTLPAPMALFVNNRSCVRHTSCTVVSRRFVFDRIFKCSVH